MCIRDRNCSVSGSISGTVSVGGVVGAQRDRSITGCSSSATVKGTLNVGGVAGQTSFGATLTACYATGNVIIEIDRTQNISGGGLVGFNDGISLLSCYATVSYPPLDVYKRQAPHLPRHDEKYRQGRDRQRHQGTRQRGHTALSLIHIFATDGCDEGTVKFSSSEKWKEKESATELYNKAVSYTHLEKGNGQRHRVLSVSFFSCNRLIPAA